MCVSWFWFVPVHCLAQNKQTSQKTTLYLYSIQCILNFMCVRWKWQWYNYRIFGIKIQQISCKLIILMRQWHLIFLLQNHENEYAVYGVGFRSTFVLWWVQWLLRIHILYGCLIFKYYNNGTFRVRRTVVWHTSVILQHFSFLLLESQMCIFVYACVLTSSVHLIGINMCTWLFFYTDRRLITQIL